MSKKNEIKTYGFGVVAQGFYNYLVANNEEERLNTVIIKNPTKNRKEINAIIEITNENTVKDKDVEVIVELISSSDEAYGIVVENLEIGKKVISANKKFIAENLATIIKTEKENNATFLYEAAVCGSIPIIKVLNDLYANEPIIAIQGIFNGSSNYILTQLFNKEVSYAEALLDAQKLGFAEANPVSDVGGFDAKYKLVIVTAHAFGLVVKPDEILNIGIENISKNDIDFAKKNGLKIKLIAKAALLNGKLSLTVLPTFIAAGNDLYQVENEYNAVQINSENIGEQFYKGKGAGSLPTGSVVYADLKAIDNGVQYSYKKLADKAKKIALSDAEVVVYSSKIDALNLAPDTINYLDQKAGYAKVKLSVLKNIQAEKNVKGISVIEIPAQVLAIFESFKTGFKSKQHHKNEASKNAVLQHINLN